MSTHTKEVLQVRPIFDFELLLGLLSETRLGGSVLEEMANTWERWLPKLHAIKIETGKGAKSAEYGYRMSALAQTMIQCAVYQLLPEVEEAGCAPAPQPTALLCDALAAEGLDYQEDTHSILPKYSVLTPYPFRGACDICYLRKECPKANGQGGGITSFELGGHQQ